ncbi:MAG: ATP phosphoribosyltransferase regulatory subunit, partial [Clostridia bacterium]|nr:ATP phosphoribosyltransferase regulatory subunit [Clostridia bacterium]
MKELLSVLSTEEITALSLCSLYQQNGYSKYRMSKFEEYDLYVRNKDFLVSESVITFTDTDGKLMALKPDVTLSIIKNSKDQPDGQMKVFYNENVYRVSKGTKSFKEIRQAGLECLGKVTEKEITEILLLASKSLGLISDNYALEISHLGIVTGVLDYYKISEDGKNQILKFLGEKNSQGVLEVCKAENLDDNSMSLVEKLVTVYGAPQKVLKEIEVLRLNEKISSAIDQLASVVNSLDDQNVHVDFSVVNDMKYYNGFAFKGFIEGIPTGILSGGQYDGLMKKMGKSSQAIGFAVYLDELNKKTSFTL